MPTGLELILHRLRVSSISPIDIDKIKNIFLGDMLGLQHAVDVLQELLRTSGVGALPLLNLQQPGPQLPSEEQLLTDTTNTTQQLFERLKSLQESSTIVTNLLSIPEQQRK